MACLALASLFTSLSTAQQTLLPDSAAQTQPQTPAQDNSSSASPQTPSDKSQGSQNKSAPGQSSQGQASQEQSGQQSGTSQSGTSKDRLFFTLPNFLTLENAGHLPPLTTKQKYAVVARGSFDYVQIPWYGFLSAVSQAEDSEPGLGQGWEGYGKRFATAFADGTIENFMVGAVFPDLLKQDPRYYQLGHGSFGHRTLYAASRNVITLTDSGKKQFNYSEVVGGMVSAAFSTFTYHPRSHIFQTPEGPRYVPSDRTLDNAVKVWGVQYGYDTLTLVVKEFWPDIRRKLLHKNRGTGQLSRTITPRYPVTTGRFPGKDYSVD
jgi:hypothetical protein